MPIQEMKCAFVRQRLIDRGLCKRDCLIAIEANVRQRSSICIRNSFECRQRPQFIEHDHPTRP
jgi:hypothetical protein